MTERPAPWRGRISLTTGRPEVADWIARSLRPEAAREVPRARARLEETPSGRVELSIDASDAGAMRAALNTYLGWVELSLATVRSSAESRPPAEPRPS